MVGVLLLRETVLGGKGGEIEVFWVEGTFGSRRLLQKLHIWSLFKETYERTSTISPPTKLQHFDHWPSLLTTF